MFSIKVKEPYPADWDGGLAGSVKDISEAVPDAKISDNVFDVYEEDAASAEDEIVKWIKSTFDT